MSTRSRPVAAVVNDDPSQLRLLCATLEKGGVATRGFQSAEAALASLSGEPADIVVTDLHMPGIDGWQFCRLLRSAEYAALNKLRILAVSATFSGRDAEQLSLEMGANGFLAAPFAPSLLQRYVANILRGERPRPSPQALIVGPDAVEAERLGRAFGKHGYSVHLATNGGEARRMYADMSPEIVLIDDAASDVDLESLLRELKPLGALTAAFVLTSEPSADGTLRAMRQGADACLAKPVDLDHLIELSEKVSRQRSLVRVEELLEQRAQALRDSETRWRSLFEAIPETVIVHDEDGVVRHVNRVGAEYLEWPAHELIGRNLRDFARPRAGEEERRAPHSEPETFETTYMSRSGRQIEVEVNQQRMQFEGKPAILSVARDIAARKELARQRANFLAMLTHDIKNPLSVVLGFTDLLGEVGDLNDEQRDLVTRMDANAQTVLSLVANYLNLARIESGSLEIAKRPAALDELLERVVDQYGGEAHRENVELQCRIERPLSWIEVDTVALERVFANLIHNALKFTPEHGRVAVDVKREGDMITVRVSDTGAGIPPEEMPTIFQAYRRGAQRQPREGSGLGLFIAKVLVCEHGGSIDVQSTPGEGSCFTVSLPVTQSE